MLGFAFGENGIDGAICFDHPGRLSRTDTEYDPAPALPDCLRGLDETLFVISGVEDEVDASAGGQLRDFCDNVVVLVVKDVICAALMAECHRLRCAAAADDQPSPKDARRHLDRKMPDAAPATRNVDRVTRLDSSIEARKSGQETHR